MAGVGLLGEGPRYGCSRGRRLQSSTEVDRGDQRHEAEWEPRKEGWTESGQRLQGLWRGRWAKDPRGGHGCTWMGWG